MNHAVLSAGGANFFQTIIFTFIAFWGLLPREEFFQILITTYLVKWLVAAVDTPFLYLAQRMYSSGVITEESEENYALYQE